MRIHHPETTIENGEVCISARIEHDTPNVQSDDALWFSMPEEFAPLLTDRIDPFALAMLLPAMAIGEDLHLDGVLSPRLAYGMKKAQGAYRMWLPKAFTPIDIVPTSYQPFDPADMVEQSTGSLFSGGVDSMFTLWSHLPQQEPIPEFQLKYPIFVHGFDMYLHNRAYYEKRRVDYQDFAKRLGLTLIPLRTNFESVCLWEFNRVKFYANMTALQSIGMVFGKGLSQMYLGSSHHFNLLPQHGSHPAIDHFYSTETLNTFNDGNHATRAERIKALAGWEPSYDTLRVCRETLKQDRDYINCGKCSKCLALMMQLELLNALDRYTTFAEPLTADKIRSFNMTHTHPFRVDQFDELYARMKAEGRADLYRPLEEAMRRSRRKKLRDDLAHNYRRYSYYLKQPIKKLLGRTN